MLGIVNDLRHRRLDPEIAPVSVHARVVCEALGVTAETQLIIGLIEAACAQNQFCFATALESRTGHDIEDSISAVPHFSPIAAAAHFQIINVFGIELRPDVGRDIGVWHRYAIDEPVRLMSPPNVKLIMRDVGAGYE